MANVKNTNQVFIFGSKAGLGVKAETKMAMEFAENMLNKYSRISFELRFPRCLNGLDSKDADFEMQASNTV